jgi:hypothetical protein
VVREGRSKARCARDQCEKDVEAAGSVGASTSILPEYGGLVAVSLLQNIRHPRLCAPSLFTVSSPTELLSSSGALQTPSFPLPNFPLPEANQASRYNYKRDAPCFTVIRTYHSTVTQLLSLFQLPSLFPSPHHTKCLRVHILD